MDREEVSRGEDSELNPAGGHTYRFGQFTLDCGKRVVYRADAPISLTPKAFDVLLFLVQNPNRLVTKQELLQAVWGSTFVEEGNLTQYISHLRKALGDNTEDSRLIVTIARKGYQFAERVAVVSDAPDSEERPKPQVDSTQTPGSDSRVPDASSEARTNGSAPQPFRLPKLLAVAALVAIVAAAFSLYWNYRHRVKLSATDTVVLAGVSNETTDPVFDDSLDLALRYEMDQTPYLNILGNDKIVGALAQLKLPPSTKLTPEIARQVCTSTNSKLVVSQSIRDAGNGYRLQLAAIDCASGATLVNEQADVAARNEVIHRLGVTAARLRAKLGEPGDLLARFNQPPERGLTVSLDALKAETDGMKLSLAGDANGGLKLYQRAVELDPNFAVSYQRIGAANLIIGNTELSEAGYTRAYQLRDQLTERGRLNAEVDYYSYVAGNWEKQYSSVLRLLQIFPRDVHARAELRNAFAHLGRPDQAADEAAEIARLQPSPYYFGSAIQSIRFASRFNEAKLWLADANALKFDNLLIRRERLIVAHATGDQISVEKQLQDGESGKYREDFLLEHALIEIQRGRFESAERLRREALRDTSKVNNANWWVVLSALEDAEAGKDAEARRHEGEVAGRELDYFDEAALALARARSGQLEQAEKLANDVSTKRPEDTLVQHYLVPTIRASIKLQRHDAVAAVDLLGETAKYELAFTGSFDYLYPAYIRGLAYLKLGDGRAAAPQFQKLIDNPGFTVRHVIGPLAWLQLGRAQKIMGDQAAARKTYETFLSMWKDADRGLPIYRQAKSEYAKLTK
jgi:DNA-binding winged helix-turn-helix (wHTH) protein